MRTVERSKNRLASRLSLLEQSSLGETLRAWSKSKTDSGSVQQCVLPVTPDRFRNKFGMTLAEPVSQLNPSDCTTKEVSVKSENYPSLRAVTDRVAIQSTNAASSSGLPRRHSSARNDRGRLARVGFTMAEILLSLTIIGVVAAITLPSLTGNINERTWNTQRKALYARMSQAFPLLGSVNGYADAETFITGALSKVLKINNICSGDKLADCGIPEKFITLAGNNFSYSLPFKISELNAKMTSMSHSDASLGLDILYSDTDTEAAAFETANGESILLFYFPKCQSDMGETTLHLVQPKICVNMIYDLNSSKGPNTVGKDVGVMTVLYSTDSMIVSPQPWYRNASTSHTNWYDALAYCKNLDEDYRLPNRDEAAAIFVNNSLFEFGSSWSLWTASSIDSNRVWEQSLGTGNRRVDNKNDVNAIVRCVKR